MSKKKESAEWDGFGLQKPLPVLFRVNEHEHDHLARLAYGRPSIAGIVRQLVFTKGWEKRAATLRRAQRAKKIPDDMFLHPIQRRERGMPVSMGRREGSKKK